MRTAAVKLPLRRCRSMSKKKKPEYSLPEPLKGLLEELSRRLFALEHRRTKNKETVPASLELLNGRLFKVEYEHAVTQMKTAETFNWLGELQDEINEKK
jgi:hypothetical protein